MTPETFAGDRRHSQAVTARPPREDAIMTQATEDLMATELARHEFEMSLSMRDRPQMYCECGDFFFDHNDGEEFTNRQFDEGVREYHLHVARACLGVMNDG